MGLGAIIGGIGKTIGTAISFKNLLGLGSSNWEDQMEQQFQNEKEMMELQHQYNEAMAQQNQSRYKKCGTTQTSRIKGHISKTQD